MSKRYGMSSARNGGASYGSNGYGNFGSIRDVRDEQQVEQSNDDDYDPYGSSYRTDRLGSSQIPPGRNRPRDQRNGSYGEAGGSGGRGGSRGGSRGGGEAEMYRAPSYGSQSSLALRQQQQSSRGPQTSAEQQLGRALDHIKQDWPAMCEENCIPAQLALQLLDTSSVGRAHEYRNFKKTHDYLQESLRNIVNEHHQGFNSSIGTFHKIQGSIQASQKRVRTLKESLAQSRTALCQSDPELQKLSRTSQMYDGLIQTLDELDELRLVPDQLEARISEKRFLTAVEVLQTALRKLGRPELDDIAALSDLRSYLANQETALMDILVEEVHEHLYLKSPYCQERWQTLAKTQGSGNDAWAEGSPMVPFNQILDAIDLEASVTEDPARNPEGDTFYYVGLLVEALNKLGRLQGAVDTLKQRLPVELFNVVNETINEVDQRHPSSLRGGSSNNQGLSSYGSRETQMRADVIYDLLWTLYGKFEAIAEGHRIFHESIKALIRREGSGNNSALLGSFKELWNLYQNEIRSLLHNYVTTDADLYQFNSTPQPGAAINGKKEPAKDLFKFADVDAKAVETTVEFEALESIIQSTVPGLTSSNRKQVADKTQSLMGVRAFMDGRKAAQGPSYDKPTESHKSLVEPSVFNMSLLLPPTLVFLQRLKNIVPPGSDLATSTLTSFLDNFLVNVFQPQLDETLGKLSESIFGESDSFVQDQNWKHVARKPIFKGAVSFFTVVTAFCRMLATIPHDQALSSLILTQMNRYYDKCFTWFKSLVTKTQEQVGVKVLRASARMALDAGEINDVTKKLWEAGTMDPELLEKEIELLITETNEKKLIMSDIIQDRDTISSLCLLYTSMKWLSVKVASLRHITRQEIDSSRPNLPRQSSKRWTLMNDPGKAASNDGPVHLPMTQETVHSFDAIVSSYEDLASTAMLTLRMEVRCRLVYSLHIVFSPTTAPYILDQDVQEPDPPILTLNAELVSYDETVVRFLRDREVGFIRTGMGRLVDTFLVRNALLVSPMNDKGCGRMQLNILVLQQNLKNVEEGVDLSRAANYFELFNKGPDAIVEAAKKLSQEGEPDNNNKTTTAEDAEQRFSFEELQNLLELCYSERLHDPERGVNAAAKREMADKQLSLQEFMWQS